MASSSKYTSIEDGYELDINDKRPPSVSIHQVESDDDLRPILPRQDPAPQLQSQWQLEQAEILGEDPLWEVFFGIYDFFLCFLAFVLLLKTSLVVYAWHYDRKHSGYAFDLVSPLTLKLLSFNFQVTTAFTIIFITIMTTVTRRLALYKAQQGAYLSDIEQLQASVSLPAVIKMVFSLRKFTKFSLILVFFWGFYYLGSQAARAEYSYAASDPFKDLLAAYPNDKGWSVFDPDIYDPQWLPSAQLATGLSSYSMNSKDGIDSMGQFLIPDPEYAYYLVKHDGTVNDTREVKVIPSKTYYLSYFGLPLSTAHTYPKTEDSPESTYWADYGILGDFTFESSYYKVYCDSASLHSFDSFPLGVLPTMSGSLNMTNSTGSAPKQLEVWTRWDETFDIFYNTTPASVPRKGSIKYLCNIVQPRVKIGVHCSETACLVNKMSCPEVDPDTLRRTRFENETFSSIFFDSLLLAGGVPPRLNESLYHKILDAMYLTYPATQAESIQSNATELEDSLNSVMWAVEKVVNSWFNLGMSKMPMNETEITPEQGYTPIKFKGNQKNPHYRIDWVWIGIDYFSGFLLLAASIYSFWLRKHTLAPDIFGFVSSLTRDNPHFPVLPGGSTLDGLDRTRALRDMKVRIGDIGGPQGQVGRVGFIPMHPQVQATRLTKERKYL